MSSAFATSYLTEDSFEDVPEEVDCPYELTHIWDWFYELDKTRQPAMVGVSPITHTEITHWANGMGIRILPFERRAIVAVDVAYRRFNNQSEK